MGRARGGLTCASSHGRTKLPLSVSCPASSWRSKTATRGTRQERPSKLSSIRCGSSAGATQAAPRRRAAPRVAQPPAFLSASKADAQRRPRCDSGALLCGSQSRHCKVGWRLLRPGLGKERARAAVKRGGRALNTTALSICRQRGVGHGRGRRQADWRAQLLHTGAGGPVPAILVVTCALAPPIVRVHGRAFLRGRIW